MKTEAKGLAETPKSNAGRALACELDRVIDMLANLMERLSDGAGRYSRNAPIGLAQFVMGRLEGALAEFKENGGWDDEEDIDKGGNRAERRADA